MGSGAVIGGAQFDSADGPGTVLPDGNILFDVSRCVYLTPTHFFLYNRTANTLTQVADTPNAPDDSTYYTRMLALPNGQVLFNDGSSTMDVYTAGGTPQAGWKPTITSVPATVAPGSTYTLSGKQVVSEMLSLCGGENIFAGLSALAPAVDFAHRHTVDQHRDRKHATGDLDRHRRKLPPARQKIAMSVGITAAMVLQIAATLTVGTTAAKAESEVRTAAAVPCPGLFNLRPRRVSTGMGRGRDSL